MSGCSLLMQLSMEIWLQCGSDNLVAFSGYEILPHCNLLFQHIYWFCDSKYVPLILQVSYLPLCAVVS